MPAMREEEKKEEIDELIDIVTVEPSELAHTADEDDNEPELLFLPTHLEPEVEKEDGAEDGGPPPATRAPPDDPKERKRKR